MAQRAPPTQGSKGVKFWGRATLKFDLHPPFGTLGQKRGVFCGPLVWTPIHAQTGDECVVWDDF